MAENWNLYIDLVEIDGAWYADWYPDGAGRKRSSRSAYQTREALLTALFDDPDFWHPSPAGPL